MRLLYFLLIIGLLTGCQSKKKQAEIIEMSKPSWLKNRPVSESYFYGIGITPKVGGSQYYTDRAKDKALADLAQQINTRVKSETSFIKTENNQGVYEYIQSRINATSNEFLEGYEFVDNWEDESNMYAFYQLSKSEFYTLKEERKNKAIELAWLKISQSNEQENSYNYVEAIELYGSAIDALSGFLNEETSKLIDGEKIDLYETSRNGILEIVKLLSIKCSEIELIGQKESSINSDAYLSANLLDKKVSGLPIKFTYSGGYIINETIESDSNGKVPIPTLKYNKKDTELLTVEVDFVNLARKVSKNLLVRQLIENQKKQSCLIDIRFK
nr:LPP20 family lipoprotein [uncultured Carboxylicivirga sp.]